MLPNRKNFSEMKRKSEGEETKLDPVGKRRRYTISNSVISTGFKKSSLELLSAGLRRSNRKSFSCSDISEERKTQEYSKVGISDLPAEILLHICSYLPQNDIYENFRLVCKRFYNVAIHYSLWEKIEVDEDVPTEKLKAWLLLAPRLKELCIKNRCDFNEISQIVSNRCKNLQVLEVVNCWGAPNSKTLKSKLFCRLVSNCRNLRFITLSDIKLLSVKLFDLIVKDQDGNLRHCAYSGPISPRQLFTFLKALKDHHMNIEDSTVLLGNMEKAMSLHSVFSELNKISNPTSEDFVHVLWNILQPDPDFLP